MHSALCSGTTGGLGSLSLLFTELSLLTLKQGMVHSLPVSQEFMCISQAGVFGSGYPSRTPRPSVSVCAAQREFHQQSAHSVPLQELRKPLGARLQEGAQEALVCPLPQ